MKCLASSAPEIWPGPQNVDMSHVTPTTPTSGIVSITRYITRPSSIRNLKSLAVAIAKIFRGCKILKCVTWPWTRPFQGWLDFSRLALATINLQTKCEVSNYTHYEDMRSGAKYTNWGSWVKVIGNVTIRQSAYDFLFDFNRNHASCTVFGDIAGYLLKVTDIDPPHLHLVPP